MLRGVTVVSNTASTGFSLALATLAMASLAPSGCQSTATLDLHNNTAAVISVRDLIAEHGATTELGPGESLRSEYVTDYDWWSRGRYAAIDIAMQQCDGPWTRRRTIFILGRGPHELDIRPVSDQSPWFSVRSPTSALSGPGGCSAEDEPLRVAPGTTW